MTYHTHKCVLPKFSIEIIITKCHPFMCEVSVSFVLSTDILDDHEFALVLVFPDHMGCFPLAFLELMDCLLTVILIWVKIMVIIS